ncbi:MAG: CDP-alcohol phosphatidyltransferase family protein [Candidatus Rokubacteria bacterium]|nr:CDP-alcohol phosphatidyltransferase family protein [Candidatus Rokubacteria bacterium]
MSLTAAIYLPDAQSRQWALCPVAGRSVLLRMLMTAVRAGVSEIGLPRILGDAAVLSQARRHPHLAPAVFSLEGRTLGSDPLLLLPADGVLDPGGLRKLLEAGRSGIPAALEESKGSPAPVVVITAEQAHALSERLVAGVPIGEELEGQVRSGRVTLVAGGGHFVSVTDAGSRREAEAVLHRSLGTEADSWVDRLMNRPCSQLLTRLLVRFPVTPNQVSLVSLALGLAAAWQFWHATPASALLGLFFYLLEVVADHADGAIARLTFQESHLGRWLDVSVDTASTTLLVLGMAATASAVGGHLTFLTGGVAGFGIIMSALFANFLPPRPNRLRRLAHLLRGIGNRDMFYLVIVLFIFLLWKAQWLLPYLIGLLAVGSQGYWLTCLAQRKLAGR